MPKVKPLYDIEKISAVKKLNDADRPYVFADLSLEGRPLRYCMSSPASQWRVTTLFTKEPTTIDWLNSFLPGDVLVDIGANIGMYAIYAAVMRHAQVYAFEPESQNYAELCRSIFLNGAHGRLRAYCAAIGEKPVEVAQLLLNAMTTGGSFNDFGVPSRDYTAAQRFAQGSVAFSLDYLVESGAVPAPTHIKIDVDGHEDKVFRGMQAVLEKTPPRSLLLECDPGLPGTMHMIRTLLAQGWVYNPDQLRLSSAGLRPVAEVEDALHQGSYAGNIIFARDAAVLAFATLALARFSPAELEAMQATTHNSA